MSDLSKMYICVKEEVPSHMVPVLAAHAVLSYHCDCCHLLKILETPYLKNYLNWLNNSFKKCVVQVNAKEFTKIVALQNVGLFHESTTLGGEKSCAIIVVGEDVPNVLKYAKLWKPILE